MTPPILPDDFFIKRLSDLPEGEPKQIIIKGWEDLCKFQFPEFDEFGLKWPVDVLGTVKFSLHSLPLEFLQEFVDKSTKQSVDKKQTDGFKKRVEICDDVNKIDFSNYNTTNAGNFAYVILHGHDAELVETCTKTLLAFMRYLYATFFKILCSNNYSDDQKRLYVVTGKVPNLPPHVN